MTKHAKTDADMDFFSYDPDTILAIKFPQSGTQGFQPATSVESLANDLQGTRQDSSWLMSKHYLNPPAKTLKLFNNNNNIILLLRTVGLYNVGIGSKWMTHWP
jgi:hypothetical protein